MSPGRFGIWHNRWPRTSFDLGVASRILLQFFPDPRGGKLMLTSAIAADRGAPMPRGVQTLRQSAPDPIYAQIELHRALVHRVNTMPDEDGSPVFQAACDIEEAALQALGNLVPTTVDAAIDQLCYMAEVEGCYTDKGSPFLRTVLSVVKGLSSLSERVAA